MKISVLSDDVINKIAAGEVIENPASVVKELIDNAIDAAAQHIRVEILAGGQQFIKIEDDGCGMSPEDVEMCLLRHATSKMARIEDLDQLQTMGFRGEALAAIAAVSKMEIVSSDGTSGTRLVAEGGRIVSLGPCARNRGVTIEVGSLFFNTPARRKFQKSSQANAAQILRMVQSLALSHPQISFVLESQREVNLHVEASDWQKRVEAIIGKDVCNQGLWIQEKNLFGWLGSAEDARSTRQGQHFFIQRRPVFSFILSKALKEGYGTRIAENAHPSGILFFDCPAEEFDVNVHPQKKEIRFHDEEKVYCLIRDSVQRVFLPNHLAAFSEKLCFHAQQPVSSLDPWEVDESKTKTETEQGVLWTLQPDRKALAVAGSFLIASRGEEVLLVDLREAFEKNSKENHHSQTLMFPVRLSLKTEEPAEVIRRFADLGMAVQELGKNQLYVDAIPEWLDEAEIGNLAEMVQQGLSQPWDLGEVLRRYCQSRQRKLSLEEAEFLWKKNPVREIILEEQDLERIFTRKK